MSYESQKKFQGYATRDDIENEFKARYQNLKQLYEMRFQALQESVRDALTKIYDDELLMTMKNDLTSSEYINQRISELFLEVLNGDREAIIEKISYQYAGLKSEFLKLTDARVKEEAYYKTSLEECQNKLLFLEENIKLESLRKVELENEIAHLQKKLAEASKIYEKNLYEREADFNRKIENDSKDVGILKETILRMEKDIKDSEERLWGVNSEKNLLKKDLEQIREEYQELDVENNALRINLEESKGKLNDLKMQLNEKEKINFDSAERINKLSKENNNLLKEIEKLMSTLKIQESDFNKRLAEQNQANQETSNNLRENNNRTKLHYKEKLKKLKAEYLEKKESFIANEIKWSKASSDLERQNKYLESNIDELRQRMVEKEEDFAMKLEEIRKSHINEKHQIEQSHERHLLEIQENFQLLLDEKMREIHEEASTQIKSMKENEKDLKEILSEKIGILERDYIKKDEHEMILNEKTRIMDKLRQDIFQKEIDSKNDLMTKIRQTEERKSKEFEATVLGFQESIGSLEKELRDVIREKKNLENIIKTSSENEANLSKAKEFAEKRLKEIQYDLEESKKKLKSQGNDLNEQKRLMSELESQNSNLKEKLEGLASDLRETKSNCKLFERDFDQKQREADKLKELNENFKSKYEMLREEKDSIKKDFLDLEKNKKEIIDQLVLSNDELRTEKTNLLTKIGDITREFGERVELEQRKAREINDSKIITENRQKEMQKEFIKLNEEINQAKEKSTLQKKEILTLIDQKEKLAIKIKEILRETNKFKRKLKTHVLPDIKHQLLLMKKENEDLKRWISMLVSGRTKELTSGFSALSQNITATLKKIYFNTELQKQEQIERLKVDQARKNEDQKLNIEKTLDESKANFSEAIATYQREISKLEDKCSQKKRTIKNFSVEISENKNQIKQLSDENVFLREKMEKSNKECLEFFERCTEYKNETEYLIAQINEEYEGKLSTYKTSLKKLKRSFKEKFEKIKETIAELKNKYEEIFHLILNDIGTIKMEQQEEIEEFKDKIGKRNVILMKKVEVAEELESETNAYLNKQREKIEEIEKMNLLLEQERNALIIKIEEEKRISDERVSELNFKFEIELSKISKEFTKKSNDLEKIRNELKEKDEELKNKEAELQDINDEKSQLKIKYKEMKFQNEAKATANEKNIIILNQERQKHIEEIENLSALLSQDRSTSQSSPRLGNEYYFSKTNIGKKNVDRLESLKDLSMKINDLKSINKKLELASFQKKSPLKTLKKSSSFVKN